ncbi:MAG TPA: hypothetical protein VGR82_04915 [Methylomirabilota bacterium]|nr:hypothetical protein [Methylomirabilota bacterium]
MARGADRRAHGAALRRVRAALGLLALLTAAPAAAHHTGVYTPKDNAISANFKQIKFAVQAGKFDVALRLFDEGALRAEMRARAAALPADLEATTRAAVVARDAAGVERGLMLFFAALARDLAREAERQLAAGVAAASAGPRFLEAIWRYYNLVDFAVGQRDARASVAMRLAYDEAEGLVRGAAAPDPAQLRASFSRIAQILSTLIDASRTARREP